MFPRSGMPFSLLPRPRRLPLPPSRPPFVQRRPAHPCHVVPYQVVPFRYSENCIPDACDPVQQQTTHWADGHFSQSLGRGGVGLVGSGLIRSLATLPGCGTIWRVDLWRERGVETATAQQFTTTINTNWSDISASPTHSQSVLNNRMKLRFKEMPVYNIRVEK